MDKRFEAVDERWTERFEMAENASRERLEAMDRRWTERFEAIDRRFETAAQHDEAAHAAICESIAKAGRADPRRRRGRTSASTPSTAGSTTSTATCSARRRSRRRPAPPPPPADPPMDPLAHTLVGATLAQTRLRNGAAAMAVPAGVLAANAPDVDAVTMFVSRDLSLGFRRGWTHGVLAMAVLPLVLTVPARARPGGGAVGAGRRHGRGHCCS